jgi:hypothetical protein
LGLDDRHHGGVLSYAPRRHRHDDDGTTIRPVLERLSRGEGREPGPRLVRRAIVHHLPPADVGTSAATAMSMGKRLAITIGALATTAVVGVGVFELLPRSETQAAVAAAAAPANVPKTDLAAALPKPVHTTTIRKADDATTAPITAEPSKQLSQANAAPGLVNASGTAAMAAADPSLPGDAAAMPLQLWAMASLGASSGWPEAARHDGNAALAATSAQPSRPDASAATHPPAAAHHTRHVASHQRTTHHQRRHAGSQAGDQTTENGEQSTQPIKKLPLQAALDRIFGSSANNPSSVPPPPQQ